MQRLVALSVLLGLVVSGCGDEPAPPLNEARTYVVATLAVPELVGTGRAALAAGFDLDGEVSTGQVVPGEGVPCVDGVPDFLSASEPGEMGVDNALVGVLPSLEMLLAGETLSLALQRQVLEGDLLLLLEIDDIDSYEDDDEVELQLFVGSVPDGSAPLLRGGALASGQVFDGVAVGASSLGAIVDGHLVATTSMVGLPIVPGAQIVARDVELRALITPTALVDGAIGGAFRVSELAALADAIMPGLGEGITTVLGPAADLDPALLDPRTCESISFGMSFGAVDAEIAAR